MRSTQLYQTIHLITRDIYARSLEYETADSCHPIFERGSNQSSLPTPDRPAISPLRVGRGNARWMVISARPSADLPFIVGRPGELDASVAEEAEHSSYIGL